MPPCRFCSAAHSISRTASRTSCIGTIATPARRSGLVRQNSVSQRLCAHAPASVSSGSSLPVEPSPAVKGVLDTPPTPAASASGKTTSAATPSWSISLSRTPAS